MTNLLSSSEIISPSSLTLKLNFSECTFLLHETSSSWFFHHVASSVKFSLIFIILFNAISIHQPIQNVVMFHILTDFTLFLLVCLKINYYLCGTTTFCIKQNKNLLWFLTDSILIYNVLKITSSIPMDDFSLNFKSFYSF